MKESELYEPVKKFLLQNLDCDDVYAEVENHDVLATCGAINIIVEMKTRLSFKLLDQAKNSLRSAEYVYIAVPRTKNHGDLFFIQQEFLRPNGIGFLQVYENPSYKENPEHDFQRERYKINVLNPARYCSLRRKYMQDNKEKNYYHDIRHSLKPFHKENIGGVKGGVSTTNYSNTIEKVKDFLSLNGWSTVEEILEDVDTHYARPKPSLVATLQESWNANWISIKIENGKRYFNIKADPN